MEKNKKIQIAISILIVFIPFIFSGRLIAFPDYWGVELSVALFYCRILCSIVGLTLIYRVFKKEK